MSISQPLVRHIGRGVKALLQEADMARQQRTPRTLKPIVTAASIGLGLVIVSWGLGHITFQLRHFFGAAAWEALGLLPSFVLTACQGLQAHAAITSSLQCPFEMLVSALPLLVTIGGAA
jgi:hypothetical protein